ncbi:MAG: PLD nuclease N-terminal domain-containing protein [Bacillota bacterium]
MGDLSLMEVIKMLAPLIALELMLKVFCLYRLSKDEVRYLPKFAWALIIILIQSFGSIAYLILGRKKY